MITLEMVLKFIRPSNSKNRSHKCSSLFINYGLENSQPTMEPGHILQNIPKNQRSTKGKRCLSTEAHVTCYPSPLEVQIIGPKSHSYYPFTLLAVTFVTDRKAYCSRETRKLILIQCPLTQKQHSISFSIPLIKSRVCAVLPSHVPFLNTSENKEQNKTVETEFSLSLPFLDVRNRGTFTVRNTSKCK